MTARDPFPTDPKMTREPLCAAQAALADRARQGIDQDRVPHWIARIGQLINVIDEHRPLGPDGKHGDRHTPTCGCEGVTPTLAAAVRARRLELRFPLDLSQYGGPTGPTVRKIESGRTEISARTKTRLEQALGWREGQVDDFLGSSVPLEPVPTPSGPLVIVRVGPPDNGYFVGPFTPQQAVEWREEHVTHPDQQWAIVPLLPDAAVPLTTKIQQVGGAS